MNIVRSAECDLFDTLPQTYVALSYREGDERYGAVLAWGGDTGLIPAFRRLLVKRGALFLYQGTDAQEAEQTMKGLGLSSSEGLDTFVKQTFLDLMMNA